MAKQLRKLQAKLKVRQESFDQIKNKNSKRGRSGYTKPGSMNRHKQRGGGK